MRGSESGLLLSPSDLLGYDSCAHRTHQDRLVALGLLDAPPAVVDAFMGLLADGGLRHGWTA